MTYTPPVADILFTLTHVADFEQGVADGLYPGLDRDSMTSIIEGAGTFAVEVLAPLNRIGDKQGARFKDGVVTTPDGWRAAYRAWVEGGWAGITAPTPFGGMGLPQIVTAACLEIWNAANMAFAVGPLLTVGAIEAIDAHASVALKEKYLPKLVSGEWMATMNLTEPQAGSDVGALRTKAVRRDDGSYGITGQKIFITYGEHDLADNIIHLVLARLPDAPPGTRGISLFLVPKMLVADDGSLQGANDVRCAGIEHKMGIHGSPTCVMIYGDAGGATGFLIGEENHGLAAMFTMMNNARLAMAAQGVGIAERAYQQALAFAQTRRQGRAPGSKEPSPIIDHPDVRRMLMTMKASIQAARAITLTAATVIDASRHAEQAEVRARAGERAGILIPIAKAFSTDTANEIASLGVQVHGGMGFIEETGAAQHMRDARIAAIYEGTNGIHAIDLVTRKIGVSDGKAVAREIAGMRAIVEAVRAANVEPFGGTAQRLGDAVAALEQATLFMLKQLGGSPAETLAGATPYLRLFALASGGTALANAALASQRLAGAGDTDPAHAGRILLARFFAENIAVGAAGLLATITDGGQSVLISDAAVLLTS